MTAPYADEPSRVLAYWHDKLTNWAYWKVSGGGFAGISGAYNDDWMHAPRLPCPLVGEALDTDDLVMRLPTEQRSAITAVYLWTVPETLEARAAVLRIHPGTLRERVRQAKFRLDDLDHQRRAKLVRPTQAVAV